MQHHWSVDEKAFKKRDPKGYNRWQLIQRINYGLNGHKLSSKQIRSQWNFIKDSLDPIKADTLAFLIWGARPSFHHYKNGFWSWS